MTGRPGANCAHDIFAMVAPGARVRLLVDNLCLMNSRVECTAWRTLIVRLAWTSWFLVWPSCVRLILTVFRLDARRLLRRLSPDSQGLFNLFLVLRLGGSRPRPEAMRQRDLEADLLVAEDPHPHPHTHPVRNPNPDIPHPKAAITEEGPSHTLGGWVCFFIFRVSGRILFSICSRLSARGCSDFLAG